MEELVGLQSSLRHSRHAEKAEEGRASSFRNTEAWRVLRPPPRFEHRPLT